MQYEFDGSSSSRYDRPMSNSNVGRFQYPHS